jgi:hypothetical protein
MDLPSVAVPNTLAGQFEMTLIVVAAIAGLFEVPVIGIIWRVTDIIRFVLMQSVGNRLC